MLNKLKHSYSIGKILSIFFIASCTLCCIIYAHPGRTDANGWHWNRSTVEYHYHTGEYAGRPSSRSDHENDLPPVNARKKIFSAPPASFHAFILFCCLTISIYKLRLRFKFAKQEITRINKHESASCTLKFPRIFIIPEGIPPSEAPNIARIPVIPDIE